MDGWMSWRMNGSCIEENSYNLPPRVENYENNFQWDNSRYLSSYNPHWNEFPPPHHQSFFNHSYSLYNSSPLAPNEVPSVYESNPFDFPLQAPHEDPYGYNFPPKFGEISEEPTKDPVELVYEKFERLMESHMGEVSKLAKGQMKFQEETLHKFNQVEATMRDLEAKLDHVTKEYHSLPQGVPDFLPCNEVEENDKPRESVEIERSYIENEPSESDSTSLFPTLEPQVILGEEPVSFNGKEIENTPHVKFNVSNFLNDENEVMLRENVVVEKPQNAKFEDEWYEVEFEMENATFEDKFNLDPSICCHYMRFLTLEEISFFWYRDGYSDCKYLRSRNLE